MKQNIHDVPVHNLFFQLKKILIEGTKLFPVKVH